MRFVFLSVLLVATAFGQSCPQLGSRLDGRRAEITDLLKLRVELEQQFRDSVADDFKAQTEGLMDEIQRNAAIKAAFAKKKLKRVIDEKTVALMALRNEYCGLCRREEIGRRDRRAGYCERCPSQPGCNR